MASNKEKDADTSKLEGIVHPHDHDVLSGRGNFVNYHAGNEHFRILVRQNKLAYVECPKPQKGRFSRLIVDEIRSRDPPGRFLKQDDETKLWYDIGDKKALDKTRQALREGAPDIIRELEDENDIQSSHPTGNLVRPGLNHTQITGLEQPAAGNGRHNAFYTDVLSPPSHVSSGVPGVGGRIVPGLRPAYHMPSGTTGIAQLGGSTGIGSLSQHLYPGDIEPTPINPNGITISAAEDRPAPAPMSRGLSRDNSLTFENLFTADKEKSGRPPINSKKMGDSSQHLSAMSFSIGDMTDASNLSAVFEDSMRITDAPGPGGDSASTTNNNQPPIPTAVKSHAMQPPSDTESTASLKSSSKHVSSSDKQKSNERYGNNFNMSIATSDGSLGLESSMMNMSFKND